MDRKNIIISAILIFLVFITFVYGLKIFHEYRKMEKYINTQEGYKKEVQNEEKEYYANKNLERVSNTSTYYIVKSCVEKYYYTLNYLWIDTSQQKVFGEEEISNSSKYKLSEGYAERLLNLFPQSYKNKYGITKQTIPEKFDYLPAGKPIISDIYEYNMEKGLSVYIVSGNYVTKTKETSPFKIAILYDTEERTFEVFPDEYLKEMQLDENSNSDKLEVFKDIKMINNNQDNAIGVEIITDEKIAEDYYYQYRYVMQYSPELAYEMLDKDYRIKRFETFENYASYIDSNKKYLLSSLKEYSVNKNENYNEYVCLDENSYCYIFRVKDCLNYDLLLDIYTVDVLEFINKYDDANDKEKAALNTRKFMDAINQHDYAYAYSCLAPQFKDNKMKTLADFEKYVKTNFFELNKYEFVDFTSEGNTFIFTIKITDLKQRDTREAELQIIMELKDNREFIMAFNIE